MAFQTVFKRRELKYVIDEDAAREIKALSLQYMVPDSYGETTVRNLYFDTDSYLLIRRSIEHPPYKEKLRLRAYSAVKDDTAVFAEIKRKYDHTVYKRRLALPYSFAKNWLSGGEADIPVSQIKTEIDYFLELYGSLSPKMLITYDREAFYSKTDPSFRLTFDRNILARCEALTLAGGISGEEMLSGKVLMEIKCTGGIPLWLVSYLSEKRIYKTTFSKYGTAYARLIFPKLFKKRHKGEIL